MALLERVGTLLRANLNDLIDRAEDPEKMVKQVILDMENQLMQVKTQVAISIADLHLLEKKGDENIQEARRVDAQSRTGRREADRTIWRARPSSGRSTRRSGWRASTAGGRSESAGREPEERAAQARRQAGRCARQERCADRELVEFVTPAREVAMGAGR
jgi:hypothetical protein